MKKTLSMIVILSITLFAETKLDNQEVKIVQENKKEMEKMDEVDKEIRVIDASIEKHKESLFKKFKEMEKIFDNYECEKQKEAINIMKVDIAELKFNSKKSLTEHLEESKTILQRLESKSIQKCGEN